MITKIMTMIITIQLIKLVVDDTKLMKAINCRLVSMAGYGMKVCMMTRNDLEKLDKIVKNILKNDGFYDKGQVTEETKKKTKRRFLCYKATSTNGITTNGRNKPSSRFK